MTQASNSMKVLAVDDNRTNLHILQVFLKKQGHEVITGENGEEAVRLFVSESPDIVLLDIMMPVMNGFEAAKQIKALVPDRWVPVVFLSALNRDENLIEGLACGALQPFPTTSWTRSSRSTARASSLRPIMPPQRYLAGHQMS